jgi:hypothetical protein
VKGSKPSLERRPVFVQYVAVRRCRFNPSFAAFKGGMHQDLLDRWRKRHPQGPLPKFEVSLPPLKGKKLLKKAG